MIMLRMKVFRFFATALLTASAAIGLTAESKGISISPTGVSPAITGVVYEDTNRSGVRDEGERGMPGIGVSNGDQVVLTGADGSYSLPASTCRYVFVTKPAGCEPTRKFYRVLPEGSDRSTSFDFGLSPATLPRPGAVNFAQITDLHVNSEASARLLSDALNSLHRAHPEVSFVVATGDLVDKGDDEHQFEYLDDAISSSPCHMFTTIGNHDQDGSTSDAEARYRSYVAPEYYSADAGNVHMLFLDSVRPSQQQDAWIKRDVESLGTGKEILAFQHHPPTDQQIEYLATLGVHAVLSGHRHATRIISGPHSLVSISQSPLLFGGMDGSPAGYRVVTVAGPRINTEACPLTDVRRLQIVYPGPEVGPLDRLIVNSDTMDDLHKPIFSLLLGDTPVRQGVLTRVSPTCWMAPLGKLKPGKDNLSIAVTATETGGSGLKANTVAARSPGIPRLKPDADWPEFMGNAQRTGYARTDLHSPLHLEWSLPTHGCATMGSPVLFKDSLAVPVADQDNLINNGIMLMHPKTGVLKAFIKTDTAVNSTCAFTPDAEDGAGRLVAVSIAGTIYFIDPQSAEVVSRSSLGSSQQRWMYASPAVQDKMLVCGNTSMLTAMLAPQGLQRWIMPHGSDWLYSSPTLAGPTLILPGNYKFADARTSAALCGLDVNSGALRWANHGAAPYGSVALAGRRGYCLDSEGTLRVIDTDTGTNIFSRRIDGGRSLSSPAVAPDLLVVPTSAGSVRAFDPRNMTELWTFKAGRSIWNMSPYDSRHTAIFSSPTITNTAVLIGSSDGKLYMLDKLTGKPIWSYDFGVPTLATPCISGNAVFTSAMDGNVYAFASDR